MQDSMKEKEREGRTLFSLVLTERYVVSEECELKSVRV